MVSGGVDSTVKIRKGVGHTIRLVFERWSVLFCLFGYQRSVRFWQGVSNAFGEAETNLLFQCTYDESLLRVHVGELDVIDPILDKHDILCLCRGSYHSLHFQVKPKLLR